MSNPAQGAVGAETMTAGSVIAARTLAGMLRSRIERAAEHKSETVSLGQFFADQIHRYLTEAGHGPEHDARSGDVPADGGDPDCDRSRDWGLRARQVHLGALSKRAAGGKWFASTNGADGLARLDNGTDGMFPVRGEWHEIEFIEALVNAYRHGDLATPAPRTDGGMAAGEDANFGDAPHDLVGEIATQVLNLPWTRLGLTDPRSGHFDHDALADRHGDVQIIAEKALQDARASDAESAWPFERTRAYLLAELERLRADLHTIGEDLTGEQGKAASWLNVAAGRVANVSSVLASATPAQPAGAVPDSLRALSEALASATAERKRTGDLYNAAARRAERTFEDLTEVYEAFEDAISKLRDAKDALADHCLSLLASHPAGQSELPILRVVVEVYPDRTDTRLTFGDRIRPEPGVKAVEQAISALQAEFDGRNACPAIKSSKRSPQETWISVSALQPQQKAMLGRWSQGAPNEDGSPHFYWQQCSGRYFDFQGERHWCLDGHRFEGAPFYGESPTHALIIAEPPPHGSWGNQVGQSEDDVERCIACDKPLKAGELVLPDAEGGTIHTACCGPERESYTGADGGPLGPNDPIPQGYVYEGEEPAGQAGDAGAVKPCAWVGGNDTCYCRTCGAEYRYGREDKPACPRNPAPDSTRTGDEGTDWVLVPAKPTEEMIAAGWIDKEDVDPDDIYRAMIAARPAAPEAQGSTRQPIETAPKDRSQILLFGALKDSRAKPSWFIGAWFPIGEHGEGWWVSSCVEVIATEWAPLPAPPASSGQGGR